MGQVSWSARASLNLQAIHDHIAPDSRFYAQRFVRGLIQATRKLEELPRCGRVVPEMQRYGFREVIYRGYRIVYRIKKPDDQIEVLAVVHGARDLKSALRHWELS